MLFTLLAPLASAWFAAGNRAIPAERRRPRLAVMARVVAEAFDPTELCVVTGGPEVAAEFSARNPGTISPLLVRATASRS